MLNLLHTLRVIEMILKTNSLKKWYFQMQVRECIYSLHVNTHIQNFIQNL